MSFETESQKDRELQRSMYLVAELLGMLKRCRRDLRQSDQIDKEMFVAIERIEYLSQEYAYTLVGTAAQEPDLYKLSTRPLCPRCVQRAMKSRSDGKLAERTTPPPVWQPAFEFAFACTRSVASDFFGHDGTSTLGSFPSCLVRLRSALRQLQQLLPPTAMRETRVEIENPSPCCADCGEAIEVEVGQK